MLHGRTFVRLLAAALLAAALGGLVQDASLAAGDKKEGKDDKKKRGGTVIGTLTDIDKKFNFIEVKADGEEKGRRYFPRWVGGAPDKGGGFDKKMVKTFRELKVGSRLRLEWEFEERPRALKIEVLARPDDKKDKK